MTTESHPSPTPFVDEAHDVETQAQHTAHLWESSTQAALGLVYIFDLENGSNVWVNEGVRAVLGWTPDQVAAMDGHLRETLIHPDDLPHMIETARSFSALPDGAWRENEYRMRHIDGSWCWLHERAIVFERDEAGRASQIMGVAVDINAQKQAELALHQTERRLHQTVDAAKLGIWQWDLPRDLLTCNEWKCRMFGLDVSYVFTTFEEWSSHIHPDDRAPLRAHIDEAIRTRDGFECEFRALWPDGTIRWISGAGNVSALDEAGNPSAMSGVSIDISRRKNAESELRRAHAELERRVEERSAQLATLIERLRGEIAQRRAAEDTRGHLLGRIVSAQEAERRHLSRELHDQFGQTLTALLLAIDSIGEGADLSESDQKRRERASELAREVMTQSHKMAWDLRPASLDNLGLVATLQQSTKEWAQSSGVAVDFVAHGLESSRRLSPELEIAFFRVVQEALANVSRHAGASQVSVILECGPHQARVVIEDNGSGFAPQELDGRRMGLLGMRERLEAVGGEFEVESSPGSGTAVFARAPLDRRKTPREEA